MLAGALHIREVNTVFVEKIAEIAVCGDEAVLRAAAQVHFRYGSALLLQLQKQRLRVFVAALHLVILTEDRLVVAAAECENRCGVVRILPRIVHERGGKTDDTAKVFRILQAVTDCTVAAHGKTRDECILALVGKRKQLSCELYKLLADELAVQLAALFVVEVEAVFTGGHDNRKVVCLCPRLNARAVHPVRIIAENAVQKVKRLQWLLLRVFRLRAEFVHRDDCVERHRAHEALRDKIHFNNCHINNSVSILVSLYFIIINKNPFVKTTFMLYCTKRFESKGS